MSHLKQYSAAEWQSCCVVEGEVVADVGEPWGVDLGRIQDLVEGGWKEITIPEYFHPPFRSESFL